MADALTLLLLYTPRAALLGVSPLPALFLALLGLIFALYMLTAEVPSTSSTSGCVLYQRTSAILDQLPLAYTILHAFAPLTRGWPG